MKLPDDPLSWLFGRQRLGVTLGLERVHALLAALGGPHSSFRTVLVGGTNGKGSTARALYECLQADGRRTALYTSPHLSRIGERFVVGGDELSRDDVAAAALLLRQEAERQEASFFEILTAAACQLFAQRQVQWAVFEVGLGGRFDATNALEPELSLVTGISLDHVDLLGHDTASIAREKAGILRKGKLAITGARDDALAALRDEAARLGAPLWVLDEEIELGGEELGWAGVRVEVTCPAGSAGGRSPLVGGFQQRNLALATAAALALGVEAEAVSKGLASTRWPGRLERLEYRGRWVVLDGAHNAEAARGLAQALERLGVPPYTLLAGVGRDKDISKIARALRSGAAKVIGTRSRYSPRALPAGEVARAFGPGEFGHRAEEVADPREALDRAVALTAPGGTIVVAGSLYLLGEVRPLLTGEAFEADERWQ
jgi:dihydrofolate synthase/folylpolyglutamate synthase